MHIHWCPRDPPEATAFKYRLTKVFTEIHQATSYMQNELSTRPAHGEVKIQLEGLWISESMILALNVFSLDSSAEIYGCVCIRIYVSFLCILSAFYTISNWSRKKVLHFSCSLWQVNPTQLLCPLYSWTRSNGLVTPSELLRNSLNLVYLKVISQLQLGYLNKLGLRCWAAPSMDQFTITYQLKIFKELIYMQEQSPQALEGCQT